MNKDITYQTQGTCSRQISLTLSDDNTIEDVQFQGGCNGNLKGLCALVRGQKAQQVIQRLEGITCGTKPTSCPDQLTKALKVAMCEKGT